MSFLTCTHGGFEEFGTKVNPAKTKVSFDCSIPLPEGSMDAGPMRLRLRPPPPPRATPAAALLGGHDGHGGEAHGGMWLPWCGLLLNTRTCEVSPQSIPRLSIIYMQLSPCKHSLMFIKLSCAKLSHTILPLGAGELRQPLPPHTGARLRDHRKRRSGSRRRRRRGRRHEGAVRGRELPRNV